MQVGIDYEFDEKVRTNGMLKTWSGAFQGSSQSICPPQCERYDEKIEKVFEREKLVISD